MNQRKFNFWKQLRNFQDCLITELASFALDDNKNEVIHMYKNAHVNRGIGSYRKLGGQVVMWGAQSAPSD